MNAYRALMRKKLLEEMYDKLSDEDKRLFVQLTIQDKDHNEILETLQKQNSDISEMANGHSWISDLSANVAGNAIWDSLLWIGNKILKRL